jgi:hypothetical protein
MTDFDKEEFWKALGRLYDSTVRMQASIERGAERQQALVESIELLTHDVEALTRNAERDSENIRTLARIAEIHERRLTQIEGGGTT